MPIRDRLKDPGVERFFQGILTLRTVDECYRFFEDICTVSEIKALGQRFLVAEMLDEGKTYDEIAQATGASSATISRIKRFLHYGADGYRLALDRLKASKEAQNSH